VESSPAVSTPGSASGVRRVKTVKTDLQKEYVSSGRGYSWQSATLRALPHPIDDITRDFGQDIYRRMLLDPQMRSSTAYLRMAALERNLEIGAAKKPDDPKFKAADKVAQFVRSNLDELRTPLHQVLYELTEGISHGHKLAEQIYQLKTLDTAEGSKLCLVDVKPKDQKATAFVVDAYFNWIGVLYVDPAGGTRISPGSAIVVDSDGRVTGMLDPRKFVNAAWMIENGDPRGTSHLRSAYTAWWLKQQTLPAYNKYLATSAEPNTIGILPPNAKDRVTEDPETGEELEVISAADDMGTVIEGMRNGSYAVIENGGDVKKLQVFGEGQVFITALDFENREIVQAVLFQTLATLEGKHQARAASQTHQDVLGLLVQFIRTWLETAILRQMIKPLVEYNFGQAGLGLLPTVSLGDVDQQDFNTFALGIAALAKAGVIHPTVYDKICEMLKLPKPSEEEIAAYEQKQAERAKAMQRQKGQGQGPNQNGNQGNQGQQDSGSGSGNGSGNGSKDEAAK
jgi:hypothetical protein